MVGISKDSPARTDIRALLEEHMAAMLANSPKDSCHFLDIEALQTPEVTFWTVRKDDRPDAILMGCGALKELDPDHGEIKSMRTHGDHLRKGVGAQMLEYIIAEAKRRGYQRLSLETGSTDIFEPALALYRRYGFAECEPFADYKPDPFAIFMTREL